MKKSAQKPQDSRSPAEVWTGYLEKRVSVPTRSMTSGMRLTDRELPISTGRKNIKTNKSGETT